MDRQLLKIFEAEILGLVLPVYGMQIKTVSVGTVPFYIQSKFLKAII